VGLYDRAIKILEQLVNVEGRREFAGDLAKVQTYRGLHLIDLGDPTGGKREARNAMIALRAEVNRTGRSDLKEALDSAANHLGKLGIAL
jgi:hypothetical protein